MDKIKFVGDGDAVAVCASCGIRGGEIVNDRQVRLEQVQIMSLRNVDLEDNLAGRIWACQVCKAGMQFDLLKFYRYVDMAAINGNVSDTVLHTFMTLFMTAVWAREDAPSWQELCDVLNGVGITTATGATWNYHNLRQKCDRLGVDREALCATRTNIDTTSQVMGLAEDAVNLVQKSPAFKPSDVNANFADLPPGMPGA